MAELRARVGRPQTSSPASLLIKPVCCMPSTVKIFISTRLHVAYLRSPEWRL